MYETFFIVYHFWLVMLHLFRDQDLLSRLSPLAYPASTTRIAFPATVWAANGVSKISYSLLPLNSKLRRTKKPPARVGQTSKHHCWRNSILYITVGENRGYSNSWRDGRLQSISLRAQKDRFYSFVFYIGSHKPLLFGCNSTLRMEDVIEILKLATTPSFWKLFLFWLYRG